ncbi:MAG: mechanosensitive ion channel [Alphaproteobacteria bacterium]|nr:mechanosensitive ion channel [Alphaproteobacteria bacterium]
MNVAGVPKDLGAVASALWTWAVTFAPRLIAALLILIVGWIIARWASREVKALAHRSGRIDESLSPVLGTVVRYAILILIVVAALGQLGVQTTSVLAALGAAGLAIGLALQGTLSNIAAGMMLLWLRPFGIGNFIETSDVAGTVEAMSLFHTQLRTWDGIYKFVPNSQLWNVALTNYSRNPTRLILLEFGISYEDDIAEGRRVLTETAAKHPGVLKDPPPAVVPLSLGDSAVVLQVRAWAQTSNFWNVRWDLTQFGKRDLKAAGITIPFPQRVLHMADADTPTLLSRPDQADPAEEGSDQSRT